MKNIKLFFKTAFRLTFFKKDEYLTRDECTLFSIMTWCAYILLIVSLSNIVN